MNSVGALLKAERERQGREMAEIAQELCITQRYLRAIEQDDLQSLPGVFFYKSFVRQYAAIVKVDAASLQAGIEALTGPVEPAAVNDGRQAAPTPIRDLDPIVREANREYFPQTRIGAPMAALAAVLIACSIFYGWYSRAPRHPAPAAVQPPAIAEPIPATPVKAEIPAPAPNPGAPAVDVTTTTGPDGVNRVVLNLSATEKTWISITCDGKQIFSGILEPSQTKTLTGAEVAKMKVGNAGGLEVRWNGKPIGPIGPRGQVRVVLFTPENFQILQPSAM